MIRSSIFLCAEDVVRDAVSSKISVFNIIEALTAESFPLPTIPMKLFSYMLRESSDPDTLTVAFEVTLNGKDLFGRRTTDIGFQGNLRTRTIIAIAGVIIPHPGVLQFSLFISDREEPLDTYEVVVSQRNGPTLETQPA